MKEPTISPSSSADFFITPSFLSTLHLLSKGHSLLILIKLLIPISDNPWSISCTLSYAKLVVVSSLPKRHLVFEASNVIIHCWIVGWNQNNLDRSPWTCHCKVITILYGALPTAASLNFVIYCFVSIQEWVQHYAYYVEYTFENCLKKNKYQSPAAGQGKVVKVFTFFSVTICSNWVCFCRSMHIWVVKDHQIVALKTVLDSIWCNSSLCQNTQFSPFWHSSIFSVNFIWLCWVLLLPVW